MQSCDASADGFAVPPAEFMKYVSGDPSEDVFFRIGSQVVDLMRLYKLRLEGARFLDVGCGCGRVARLLAGEKLRSYRGFDRHHGMVAWCQRHIAPKAPGFEFLAVDVQSPYTSWDGDSGTVPAAEFVFPYPSRSFDSALLASVFYPHALSRNRRLSPRA